MATDILDKSGWEDLVKLAESGDCNAQYEVGFILENGLKVQDKEIIQIDIAKAFEWYYKSYENGNIDAAIRVADFLSEGVYCKKDIGLAIQLYNKGIKKGSSIAANNLATIYRDKHEFEKAFEYYALAQELDKTNSLKLALCYLFGIGTEQNEFKAFEIFQKISNQESEFPNFPYEVDEANYYLGRIYLEGKLVTKSLEEARHYLELANIDDDHRSANELLLIIGRDKKVDTITNQ